MSVVLSQFWKVLVVLLCLNHSFPHKNYCQTSSALLFWYSTVKEAFFKSPFLITELNLLPLFFLQKERNYLFSFQYLLSFQSINGEKILLSDTCPFDTSNEHDLYVHCIPKSIFQLYLRQLQSFNMAWHHRNIEHFDSLYNHSWFNSIFLLEFTNCNLLKD